MRRRDLRKFSGQGFVLYTAGRALIQTP